MSLNEEVVSGPGPEHTTIHHVLMETTAPIVGLNLVTSDSGLSDIMLRSMLQRNNS